MITRGIIALQMLDSWTVNINYKLFGTLSDSYYA